MSRGALATPCGLLFNELACSPHTTVDAVINLLTLALDLDIGKVSELERLSLSACGEGG